MPDLPTALYVVTGSRDWDGDPDLITGSLRDFAARHPGHRLVLYHGACQGECSVDMLAGDRAMHLGWEVVPFPADWRKHGKAAGMIRNREMCKTAAAREADGTIVEVHGWPSPDSTGTHDCLRAAKECGLHGLVHAMRRSDG